MIEILKDGTIIVSLGMAELLFVLYIILELVSIRWRKISLIHSIALYSIYLYRLEKTIPVGWRNKTILYDFFSIRKNEKRYSIMQHLDSEVEEKRIYSFVYIDGLGRIVRNDLPEVCAKAEETMDQSKLKSFKREKQLKDLGI